MTLNSKSTNRTTITTHHDQRELIQCVQYGFPDDKGPTREPRLRTIFDPVPDGATTVSPIYLLEPEEYNDQANRENPYRVKDVTSVATELQNECEADNRVLYPVHIESDELRDLGATPLIEWFQEFVEDCLDMPYHSCRVYFSGNRSIHVHVPLLVEGDQQRERLKELAETFCEEAGAELDCELYSRKRMFRLPGVEHAKTGVPKLEIQGEWDDGVLARRIETATPDAPETYADVLQHVFGANESVTIDSTQVSIDDLPVLSRVLDTGEPLLEFELPGPDIETPLIESNKCPGHPTAVKQWTQYNAKEFSPYAYAAENPRSVAALRVTGGAFARRKKRDGATMIPAWFYGAIGCNGAFTKEQEHAPLQLSPQDYDKWKVQPGDTAIIIGGQSRQSKILDVDSWQAAAVGHALTGDDGDRDNALDYLEAEGYDTGSAGSTTEDTSPSTSARRSRMTGTGTNSMQPAGENPDTEAEELQQQAEQGSIETLTYSEHRKVAHRLLRDGWKPARDWFKQQYGAGFDPKETWRHLRSIVDMHDDYPDVEVPPRP